MALRLPTYRRLVALDERSATTPIVHGGLWGNDDPNESPLISRLRALARHPDQTRSAWLATTKARAHQTARAGHTAEAIRLFERARLESSFPDPDIELNLGELRTIRRLERHLEVRPNDTASLGRLSQMYFCQEVDARAYECALRYAAIAPNDPEPHVLMAINLHFQGKFQAAIDEYRSTLRLRPYDPRARCYLPQAEAHLPPDFSKFSRSS